MHNECIFCKIIAKEIPSTIIRENDSAIIIKDINPKAPIHYLIIPKMHFPNLMTLQEKDISIMDNLFLMIKNLANELSLPAFRIVINNGKDAGQCVFHFHMHLLSGKKMVD